MALKTKKKKTEVLNVCLKVFPFSVRNETLLEFLLLSLFSRPPPPPLDKKAAARVAPNGKWISCY